MRIEEDVKLDFKDVLIRPKRSTLESRNDVDLTREFTFRHSPQHFSGVPIIAANMDGVGTMQMARAFTANGNGLTVALTKHYPLDILTDFFNSKSGAAAWYSMGIRQEDIEKYNAFKQQRGDAGIDKICIDVPNGYTERFVNFCAQMREENPNSIIMAGNVVTNEIVEELILDGGVDIVKVGIGPGSVCTTRKMTGVGYPQLSAVIECADAAHGVKGLICADGGCAVPGDIAKAFGGGADFVMLGGMLAGHTECEGDIHEKNGKRIVSFYGMSSTAAMEKHHGGVAGYRASEGKEVEVAYRGDVAGTLQDILGGLRSACTYVGAEKLKELPKRTTFVRVTQQLNPMFGNG